MTDAIAWLVELLVRSALGAYFPNLIVFDSAFEPGDGLLWMWLERPAG